jgi:hypothetical protein
MAFDLQGMLHHKGEFGTARLCDELVDPTPVRLT